MKKPCVEKGERDGKNRIFLFSDWEPGVADKCKSVSGYKWAPEFEGKPWTYPLTLQTCLALRNVWGPGLVIGPKLWRWAREQQQVSAENRKLARLPDSPLEVVKDLYPEVWDAMSSRAYQRSGAEFLARLRIGADFDEPGLGKTLTSMAAIMQAGKWDGRHLVICPKTAIESTWMHELNKWTDARVYAMPDGFANRENCLMDFLDDDKPGSRWLVVHPNMIQMKYSKYCPKCKVFSQKEMPDQHYEKGHTLTNKVSKCDWPELFEKGYWDSIVADECHKYLLKLRPPSARAYETAPQWAHGMRALIKASKPDGLRIPMTGTPFRGHEQNLFGILHWMDPETYSSFWRWAEGVLEVEEEEHKIRGGHGAAGQHKIVGRLRKEKEQGFFDMMDSLSLRRTRREVRADLPELDIQERWVPLEGKHFKQYDDFEDKGITKLEDGILESIGVLQELTRLRQLSFGTWKMTYKQDDNGMEVIDKMVPLVAESPKVELLLDMLEERGAIGENQIADRKFIIASQWTQILDGLRDMFEEMGVATLMITGKVTGKRRSQAVTSFRSEGGPRILLLNTQAGGTSLTLDEQCDEMFVLDETWIQDDQDQLFARINNRGQDIRPRSIYLIRTKDTVEEGIALRNTEQKNMQDYILDGRRGIKFALELMGVPS